MESDIEVRNNPTVEKVKKLRREAHLHAVESGFCKSDLSLEHSLCLVISELMEAVEADRIGKHCKPSFLDETFKSIEEVKRFESRFLAYVKDTVEDELADVAIRIFSIEGTYGINGQGIELEQKSDMLDGTFTEIVFRLVRMIIDISRLNDIDEVTMFGTRIKLVNMPVHVLNSVFICLLSLANKLNFDLIKHIEVKMRYNSMRPHMHGKRY